MIADSTSVDWPAIEDDIRPNDIDNEAWNIIWSNFKAQLGYTWAQYLRTLNNDATYLYRRSLKGSMVADELLTDEVNDTSLYDIRDLLQFEFVKASAGLCLRFVLAASQDVFIPAPGLPLTFGRFALQSIPGRFRSGPMGRGWSHVYEYTASIEETVISRFSR